MKFLAYLMRNVCQCLRRLFVSLFEIRLLFVDVDVGMQGSGLSKGVLDLSLDDSSAVSLHALLICPGSCFKSCLKTADNG